jgi:hypothetical protein
MFQGRDPCFQLHGLSSLANDPVDDACKTYMIYKQMLPLACIWCKLALWDQEKEFAIRETETLWHPCK